MLNRTVKMIGCASYVCRRIKRPNLDLVNIFVVVTNVLWTFTKLISSVLYVGNILRRF